MHLFRRTSNNWGKFLNFSCIDTTSEPALFYISNAAIHLYILRQRNQIIIMKLTCQRRRHRSWIWILTHGCCLPGYGNWTVTASHDLCHQSCCIQTLIESHGLHLVGYCRRTMIGRPPVFLTPDHPNHRNWMSYYSDQICHTLHTSPNTQMIQKIHSY